MALNSLFCADVPLSNYSLTRASKSRLRERHLSLKWHVKLYAHLKENWNKTEIKRFQKTVSFSQNKMLKHRETFLAVLANHSRLRFDILFVYKMLFGLVWLDFRMFFTLNPVDNTRGHCYKLLIPSSNTDIRKYFFLSSYCQSRPME